MEKLRHRMSEFLGQRTAGLLCGAGPQGAWALPVCYHSDGLAVVCWLPRWVDVLFYLEQDPRALLVVLDPTSSPMQPAGGRWLRYEGRAELLPAAPLSDIPASLAGPYAASLYCVVRLTPRRLELFDENEGWGARETLDL